MIMDYTNFVLYNINHNQSKMKYAIISTYI